LEPRKSGSINQIAVTKAWPLPRTNSVHSRMHLARSMDSHRKNNACN
jgi:hypothetical protein